MSQDTTLTISERLREAANHLKAGDKSAAKPLIASVLKEDNRHAHAWYLAAYVYDDPERKIKALETALSINPNHAEARKALVKLRPGDELDGLLDVAPERPLQRRRRDVKEGDEEAPPKRGGLKLVLFSLVSIVLLLGFLGYRILLAAPGQTIGPFSLVAITCTKGQWADAVKPKLVKFLDTVEIAGSTSRMALAPIVQDLQSQYREIEKIDPPECIKTDVTTLERGLSYTVDGFVAFLGQNSLSSYYLETADNEFEKAHNALMAQGIFLDVRISDATVFLFN